MKLSARYTLPVPVDRMYAAMIDPQVLQRCIPGCESLVAAGEGVYDATIKVGLAGLKGTYTGRAELRDEQPPHAFTLVVNGKGTPGFVRATAKMTLAPAAEGATVQCDADVQVGGLIASVGSRLVEAAARQQMDAFFRKLREELSASELRCGERSVDVADVVDQPVERRVGDPHRAVAGRRRLAARACSPIRNVVLYGCHAPHDQEDARAQPGLR